MYAVCIIIVPRKSHLLIMKIIKTGRITGINKIINIQNYVDFVFNMI
jgi:hypothetical protein